jgi:uncharacterized protein (DUF1697 family)
MTRVRVEGFTISLDGYGAGPNQDINNPLGVGGTDLHQWSAQPGIAPVGKDHVALLRGINVGGKNLLPMKLLVRLFESCGCRAVETYIQSWNVIFEASAEVARRLSKAVSQAILKESRLTVPVIIRPVGELAAVVSAQPFRKTGADPKALHVAFLADEPSAAQLAALDSRRSPPDRPASRPWSSSSPVVP